MSWLILAFFFLEFFIKVHSNIKFYCIITSSNSFNVPLYKISFSYISHVLDPHHDEQGDAYCATRYKQALLFAILNLFNVEGARHLDEDLGSKAETLFFESWI